MLAQESDCYIHTTLHTACTVAGYSQNVLVQHLDDDPFELLSGLIIITFRGVIRPTVAHDTHQICAQHVFRPLRDVVYL